MQSNLPAGAETDLRAPWNQVSDLCKYCDRDIIHGMALEASDKEERTVEELEEAMLEQAGMCGTCYKDQKEDDDEWINWRD